MKPGRFLSAATLASVGIALAMMAGRAFCQERPGIRPFVKPPEGCSISDTVDADNLFSFTMAEVQALSLAEAGESERLQLPLDEQARVQQMAKTMTRLREERIGYTCAGFLLAPFTASKIESAATAAKYMVFAFDELGKMTNEMLGAMMQSAMRSGSAQHQLSELKDKRQGILRNMTDALNVSLSLLVDQSHTNSEGKHDLLLTRTQKSSILDFIRSHFPSRSYTQDDFTKQAALIQSFLSGDAR